MALMVSKTHASIPHLKSFENFRWSRVVSGFRFTQWKLF
ncbi:hypothetical protein MSL71_10370 [Desulfoluna butyratoxydans]|uniref:Uncharacterized protein n=1 Tax=Desulfoluna butyratoxydans TaxID=231438 RepID=A0A4V6IL15_9BACT|nr:hypothetical protein MSL71_10370 [Desulfoluna butyratoxydans]